MLAIDYWRGLERFSDSWCQKQAELLEEIKFEEIDTYGLACLLSELAHGEWAEAERLLVRWIYNLLKIAFASSSANIIYWKEACLDFQDQFWSVFFIGKARRNTDIYEQKDELLSLAWKRAIKLYRGLIEIYPEFQRAGITLPSACPWTFDQFLSDMQTSDFVEQLLNNN